MKLIFAQGNPEERYRATRHNVGFWIIDTIAGKQGAVFTHKSKFFAEIAEYNWENEKVILAKPTTYYNETGRSLHTLADFYKLESQDILIIHDDLALPLGTLRTRTGGSGAGNNGIKSINAHGGEQTNRLRIGVANELLARIPDVDFVLSKFTLDETKILTNLLPQINSVVENFLANNFEVTTHK